MAKIALITDTHAGTKNDSPIFHGYFRKCYAWYFDLLEKEGVKCQIHLGDILDRRKYVSYATAQELKLWYLEASVSRGIETHILAGNHDIMYRNTSSVNALDELISGRYENIHTYVRYPKVVNFDGLDMLLLPWINDENIKESLDVIKNTRAEILMGHLELTGFEMYKNSICDHGMDKNIFQKFDTVYSGHFHHRSRRDNIQYLGAFGSYTWGDYNDPRGFSILDTETRSLTFHQNPYTLFKVYQYDENDSPRDLGEYGDTYVRLLCKSKTDPYKFDLFLERLEKVNPLDITIIENEQLFTENDSEEILDQTESTEIILETYIDSLQMDLERSKMKSYMKNLYREAMTLETIE